MWSASRTCSADCSCWQRSCAYSAALLAMPLCVFALVLLGLFSKESVLVALPLVPWVALLSAPIFHPTRPLRALRAVAAFVASAAALVVYTYFRRRFFPVLSQVDAGVALPAEAGASARALAKFLHWFQQPQLPHDPGQQSAGRCRFCRIAWRARCACIPAASGKLVFPWPLSGDYSFPQEPIPERVYFPESILGGVLLVLPPIAGVGLWLASLVREARARARAKLHGVLSDTAGEGERQGLLALLAIGLVWLPIAYFPHSNIPVLLPTIRAERFWYLPAFGSACVLAVLFTRLLRTKWPWGASVVGVFLAFQALAGRWQRLRLQRRFESSGARRTTPSRAAPRHNSTTRSCSAPAVSWKSASKSMRKPCASRPMAHGSRVLRRHPVPPQRAEQAWPHYMHGFELAPNDLNLIALGLQCAWEEKIIDAHKDELLAASEAHPGSWLAFLGSDLVYNGVANGGVQKKYRPRAYDEGPKGMRLKRALAVK